MRLSSAHHEYDIRINRSICIYKNFAQGVWMSYVGNDKYNKLFYKYTKNNALQFCTLCIKKHKSWCMHQKVDIFITSLYTVIYGSSDVFISKSHAFYNFNFKHFVFDYKDRVTACERSMQFLYNFHLILYEIKLLYKILYKF